MANQQNTTTDQKRSLEIARETFKQMAAKRMVPSPENYTRVYHEISGIAPQQTFESAFKSALSSLDLENVEELKWVKNWQKCLADTSWDSLADTLSQNMDLSIQSSQAWPNAIRQLLKNWETKYIGLSNSQKSQALEKVFKNFGQDALLAEKLQNLAKNWETYKKADSSKVEVLEASEPDGNKDGLAFIEAESVSIASPDELSTEQTDNGVFNRTPDPFQQSFNELKEVLRQSIKYGFIPRLDGYPELQNEAHSIYQLAENAKKLEQWQVMLKSFRALIVKVELINASESGVKNDLLRMLKMLIENVGELVDEDAWLRGQVATIQTIIASPLDRATLINAEQSLKEVIYKQGLVKNSLNEAKEKFKKMVSTFADRLTQMTDSTGDYANTIGEVTNKLAQTNDMVEINQAVEHLMHASNVMQTDLMRSRDDLIAQTAAVDEAEAKIKLLESELSSLSEQVRVDQLTGVLNRRGMDEAFEQEIARADRSGEPLSVALLDIDNFKSLNDNYGHDVGDDALKHLAEVIKSSVRPTDVVTRFGGEEFVILLPATELGEASTFLLRVQRALTKAYFMANQSQLVITFSAGIALYRQGEEAAELLHRADQAMYLAKRTGKNKAMTEQDLLLQTKTELSR